MTLETITDPDELQIIIWGDHLLYDTVDTIEDGHSRWHINVTTVFKRITDGKLFITDWRQGSTENQEHEYPDEAVEAEAYIEPVTKYRIKKCH